MKHYDDLTKGLQVVLMQYTRGYTRAVVFESKRERLEALAVKFEDDFGISLPGWKRHDRKRQGLPNAFACSMPVPGKSESVFVVLMAAFDTLADLHSTSPWHKEKWSEKVQIGDYVITTDQRDRRDFVTTWRLTPACVKGLEAYWRDISKNNMNLVVREATAATAFYPMFGGVRRQLRRLIRGYAKLYEARLKTNWPGPDPEKLPVMSGFRKAA